MRLRATLTILGMLLATAYGIPASGQALSQTNVWAMNNGPEGRSPWNLIEASDGNLYGVTQEDNANQFAGTVFRVTNWKTTTPSLKVLHVFSSLKDGIDPRGGLVQASDGNLYGTTFSGGLHGQGAVFRMTLRGDFTVLHAFIPGPNTDGQRPAGTLIQANDGLLYGTTAGGGWSYGNVFRIATDGSNFAVVYTFDGTLIGPTGGVIQASDGNLYGTISGDAVYDPGGIFSITTGGTSRWTHAFSGSDGSCPVAGLIQAPDGNLYGTTESGGPDNRGTIFRIGMDATFTSIHSFLTASYTSDGGGPACTLIQPPDGNLYGTTPGGGSQNGGTLFRISTSGTFATVFDAMPYRSFPDTGVIQASDGNFYGTFGSDGIYRLSSDFPPGSAGFTISPGSIDASSPAFTLTVKGTGFHAGDHILWGSATLTQTHFVSSTRLTAKVEDWRVATTGWVQIGVENQIGYKILSILQTTLHLVGPPSAKKDGNGNWAVKFGVANSGYFDAQAVAITSCKLNGAVAYNLPMQVGDIVHGGTSWVTVTFPGSAGASGQTVTLQSSGGFTGGTFSGSIKVTLP